MARPENPAARVSLGAVRHRGDGSRAAAADVAATVTSGLQAGLARLQREAASGQSIDLASLKIRLGSDAKPAELAAAVEQAIVRAARSKAR
jgi:hypothetical protein